MEPIELLGKLLTILALHLRALNVADLFLISVVVSHGEDKYKDWGERRTTGGYRVRGRVLGVRGWGDSIVQLCMLTLHQNIEAMSA